MRRTNSTPEALESGTAALDLGDGLETEIPLGKRAYIVDESVGRTVRVWDYLNQREQMIYGETGARNIHAELIGATGGSAVIYRSGSNVELTLYDVSFDNINSAFYTLPAGFRPGVNKIFFADLHVTQELRSRLLVSAYNHTIAARGGTNATPAFAVCSFTTNDPWPTKLPGVAA